MSQGTFNKGTYGTMYYVDSMKESVDFYKKCLGVSPVYESNEWTEFPIGSHNLCLHLKALGQPYRENGVLILKAEGLKSLYEKMKNDGLKVRDLKEVHPGSWSFHMDDQSRNEISFFGTP